MRTLNPLARIARSNFKGWADFSRSAITYSDCGFRIDVLPECGRESQWAIYDDTNTVVAWGEAWGVESAKREATAALYSLALA